MKELDAQGCYVSISEIKDAVDLLENVDLNDTELVRNVLRSTLGKTDECRAVIEGEGLKKIVARIHQSEENKQVSQHFVMPKAQQDVTSGASQPPTPKVREVLEPKSYEGWV